MRQLASLLLAAAVLSAAVAPAHAQQKPQPPMRDYEYSFRVSGSHDDGHPMSGTMRVSGDRGRIDLDGAKEGEFMVLTDGGRTLTIVHPERREYEVSDAATFEHIVGHALRAAGPVLSIKLEAAHVASDHLGDGGLVVGHATRHVRLTQDYTIRVGALGFGGDAERHVATTEYWVSPGLALMRNPLLALVEGAESALVQSDTAYSRIADAERDALLEGATPLRRVVTTREERGGKTTTQTIEITSLRPASVEPAIFQVPSGYTRRAGVSWLSSR